jgi:hypothetical protein
MARSWFQLNEGVRIDILSVLHRFEQSGLQLRSAPQVDHYRGALPSRTPTNSVDQERKSLVKTQYGISTRSRQQWILSSLRSFGIHVQKSARETSIAGYETSGTESTSDDVTFASYEAIWSLLGHGVHWSRTHPYGNILPALRVFPVVESTNACCELFKSGTLQEIQQAFRSGVVHPFTKSQDGYNLLHVSYKTHKSVCPAKFACSSLLRPQDRIFVICYVNVESTLSSRCIEKHP